MLTLNYGFICDAATVSSDGKVNILGIFDGVNSRKFPLVCPRMTVVSNWKGDVSDYKLSLKLVGPGGKEVMSIPNMQAKIKHPGAKANILADLNQLKIDQPGHYLFQFSIDGQQEKFEIPLKVNEVKIQ